MIIKPVFTRILAKQYDDDKVGQIYIPEKAKEASLRATVLEIGEDVTRVAPGDRIIVGKYAKFQVPLRDAEFNDTFIMNEADILAVLYNNEEDLADAENN